MVSLAAMLAMPCPSFAQSQSPPAQDGQAAAGQGGQTQGGQAKAGEAKRGQTKGGKTPGAQRGTTSAGTAAGGAAAAAAAGANTAAAQPKGPQPHFDIDDFAVQGATKLSQFDIEEAIYPYLGPHKTADDVEKARAALEKAYHDKGYQTVSVSVPAQNVQNKVVVLKVTELKVGRLRVKNSRYFDVNDIKKDAPSLAEGAVPNFGDVTKDIVSLNQLPDRKVTPALRAGVTPGTVDVDLNVDDTLPLHGSLELNNRQSPNTTPLRLNASAQYNDLWQLGHSVSVSYQIAPMRPADAEVFSGSYLARVPHIDWLSFLVYGVDSNSDVAAIGGLNIVGPGQIIGARGVMTLPSAENFYHTLSLGPDYKHFGESVSQTGGSFSSPVTYYPLVANYTNKYQTDKYSAQLTASVTGNLRLFSSDPTEFDNRRFLASGSFVHLNIDTAHTQELPQGFQLYGRLQGQLADGPLVSSEQMALGGLDTVRGYLESETLGDDGVAGTFELRSPDIAPTLQKMLPQPPKDQPDNVLAHIPVFNEWRFFVFADAGVAQVLEPLPQQQSKFDLWSAGAGTRFKFFNYLNGMVVVAVPMISQTYTPAYDPRVVFRIWGEF
jgi:hemolysin activation/secretion protein